MQSSKNPHAHEKPLTPAQILAQQTKNMEFNTELRDLTLESIQKGEQWAIEQAQDPMTVGIGRRTILMHQAKSNTTAAITIDTTTGEIGVGIFTTKSDGGKISACIAENAANHSIKLCDTMLKLDGAKAQTTDKDLLAAFWFSNRFEICEMTAYGPWKLHENTWMHRAIESVEEQLVGA